MSTNVWRYAWPAVMCTPVFFDQKVNCNSQYFSLFPTTFTNSWTAVAQSFGYTCQLPIFNDYDAVSKDYESIFQERKASNLKYFLKFFTFPFIKCPLGCSTQLTDTNSVPFKHLLNYLFPKFTAFKSSKHQLRCLRNDFLTSMIHLKAFYSSPCLTVTSKGLVLVTCKYHVNVTRKNLVHLQTHLL